MKNTFSSTLSNSIRLSVCILTILILTSPLLYSQDTATPDEVKPAAADNKPVKSTFENQLLINNQTVMNPSKKTLDFVIQHRFGLMKQFVDLGGLYAPSNIRLGLTYGITDRLALGIGATKLKRLYDFQWKYILLKQTKSGSMPVTVSYYGDLARSAMDKNVFLNQDSSSKGTNRLSYFHELMVARKINSHLSVQVAGTMTYFNLVPDSTYEHANYGISCLGRYQFSPQSSVIVDFDMPFTTRKEITYASSTDRSSTTVTKTEIVTTKYYPKPNFGLGLEVATSGHQFQIFLCTADQIINQETRVFNVNDVTKREFMLGFNITRQWGF